MITKEEKKQALETILTSKTFSKSTTSNILLKYLVMSSLEEKNLNTTDIAMELFGSQYEPEKSEATVRVNVYHLRKKLKKHFETEGTNNPIYLEIYRGQYGVTFKRKEKHNLTNKKKIQLVILGVLTLIAAFFILKKQTYKDPVWNSIFKSDNETKLYLYDIFGYYGPTLFNKMGWHRDYEINSSTEFYKKIENHPDLIKQYAPGRNLYVNFLSSYSVNNLSRYFEKHNNRFNIDKFHNLSPLDLKDQNSIYLGPLRHENAFVDFFNLKSKYVKLISKQKTDSVSGIEFFNNKDVIYNEDRNIAYKNSLKGIDTIIQLNSDGHSFEHVLVAKLKGDNNTSNLMFFSNHGFGATAAVEFFTNNDSIRKFNEDHLKQSDEFITLFYVSGKERTGMNIKQIFFDDNK